VIKRNTKQHTALYILLGGTLILMILLIGEYYSLRMHVEKICALQDQYYAYIDAMQRVMHTPKLTRTSESCAVNFTIDRRADYLKESALSYVKEQQLDERLSFFDKKSEDMHSESTMPDACQEESVPQWAQIAQRDSETGITFVCPLDRSRFWLSSLFGSRKKPNGQIGFHQGIDMAAQRGTEVRAAATGLVEYVGYAQGYGNTIVIVHDEIYKTRYAHLDEVHVKKNQKIEQGTTIGAVGDTGFTIKKGHDASHLHFELYERGKQVNPLVLISL
jgi:murein DD-endopeptidase MepM/ murein hydrolase activator NlpD